MNALTGDRDAVVVQAEASLRDKLLAQQLVGLQELKLQEPSVDGLRKPGEAASLDFSTRPQPLQNGKPDYAIGPRARTLRRRTSCNRKPMK